jgi:hypothetical protein
VKGLKVRGVEAYNYTPQMGSLISYGHSTAELWVEELQRWVLFDPWLAIMVADEDGIPVGAADLQRVSLGTRDSRLQVIPLAEKLNRTYRKSDGSIVPASYLPVATQLLKGTHLKMGYTPGYLVNFRQIVYREHQIR